MPPAVSIVVPLYNKGAEVKRAIASIVAQTIKTYEVVVVDDGSTDEGPAVVEAVGDPRIRLIRQQNAGVSEARNRGIREARGDLIAFLDADDEWEPDFLETVLRLRERFPQCSVYATGYTIVTPEGSMRKALSRGMDLKNGEGVLTRYFRVAAESDPPLHVSAVAASKSALLSVGGFPVGVTTGEDLLTWARLASRYQIAYCKQAKARFWAPMTMEARPGRTPQEPDLVARELRALGETADQSRRRELQRYLSHWHRMRGVIYLHLGNTEKARAELLMALRDSLNVRAAALLLFSLLLGRNAARLHAVVSRAISPRWKPPLHG